VFPRCTSGLPDESIRTREDLPTLGAPTRHTVGVRGDTTGIALKTWQQNPGWPQNLLPRKRRKSNQRGQQIAYPTCGCELYVNVTAGKKSIAIGKKKQLR
jgi:hypothetical protein